MRPPADPVAAVPPPLWRRWQWTVIGAGAALLALGLVQRSLWQAILVGRWALGSLVLLGYLSCSLRQLLPNHHPPGDSRILPSFGSGTRLSLLRAACIGLLGGYLLVPRPPGILAWLPMLLYTSADVADYFDGYLARRSHQATLLGEKLDLQLDSIGLMVAVLLAVRYAVLPPWFLVFGAARYAFAFGLWLRRRAKRPIYDLPPSRARRPVAGLAMGYMSAVLWPIVSPPATIIAGLLFLTPFAAIFLRDWLVVSGALDPASPGYRQVHRWTREVLERWLPVPLRLAAALTGWRVGWDLLMKTPEMLEAYAEFGFANPAGWLPFLGGLLGVAVLLTLLGFLGRTAALVGVFTAAFTLLAAGLTPTRTALLVCLLGVVILGTGEVSLWAPEAVLFRRRAAEA